MTNPEQEKGATRDDLLQRIALMETMIAEGRRSTTRCGWIFVLWGTVEILGMGWQWRWPSYWIWPTTLIVGFLIQGTIMGAIRNRSPVFKVSLQDRSIGAIWSMMGLAITLYVLTAIISHLAWQYSFLAGIFMMVGMAHAISAMFLRWRVQGVVAALWWAGGVAMFFAHSINRLFIVFPLEMLFGMVFFGLYAMRLERRERASQVRTNV